MKTLTIGTRTSQLALWQTNYVSQLLQNVWPELACQQAPFVTQGDKTLDKPLPQIGGKGLFTAELEESLREGRIDLAVHSLKDLPVENAPGLTVGAIIGRADVRDALVAKNGWTLDTLPAAAVVGTSSLRRQAQLLRARPDLQVRSIRGNVETRIRKALHEEYDATILAAAGVTRLELSGHVTQWLPLAVMLPAPGQGALAVQCRADDAATLHLLAAVDQADVRRAVTAERSFLHHLGGGCAVPVAAYAVYQDGRLALDAFVGSPDGQRRIRVQGTGENAWELGAHLAQTAVSQGAMEILTHV
ncbi:MAG: hydroxymethylbilane synthase [Ardenticatenaceae bacterium]|nr:hydroxymethylbilane synthase [Ardenticatenaceae bacterium]